MQTDTLPHLLLFREPAIERLHAMTPEQRQGLVEQWNAWYDRLADAGQAQQGHPLYPSGRMVSGARGERVTDGPYAESKEAIAGYFLLAPMSLDEATRIGQQCPGLPYGYTVEVRPLGEKCGLSHWNERTGTAANAGSA